MQIPFVPAPLAPLATGHPIGLPDIKKLTRSQTRVDPVAATGRTTGWDSALPGRDPQLGAYLDRDGEEHPAPPSLMQLKISELLAEQVEALDADAPSDSLSDARQSGEAQQSAPLGLPALSGYQRTQQLLPRPSNSRQDGAGSSPDPTPIR